MIIHEISKNRLTKSIILMLFDIAIIYFSYWAAFWLRLDRETPITSYSHWLIITVIACISILFFIRIGFYRAVIRYVNISILRWALVGAFASSFLLIILSWYHQAFLPRTVPILYFFLLAVLLAGSRIFYRNFLHHFKNKGIPVIIYGAGETGRQLVPILKEHKELNPVCYIDDAPIKKKNIIQGIKVYSIDDIEELISRYHVKKILLAMPRINPHRKKEILQRLEESNCEILSTPDFNDIVNGVAKLSSLKRVSITDLLGRKQVSPIPELLEKNIFEKNILITGAGGSIGSELCRKIKSQSPNLMVLYEMSEFALYSIHKELSAIVNTNTVIIPILGDVKNKSKIIQIISKYNINTIYHAAAYKHVPLVEYNIIEGIKNNIFGTLSVAEAANECNVEKFVLISTDKAVRPTNIMGATKRFAELILQALADRGSSTQYSMVRFGNVLGSSGSVVPLFEKQIANGGPITLTHQNITRYFMTIPEAASLVIQAGAMGKNGDVFVLDMGEPVRIFDLATKMVKLSGLTLKDELHQDGDIEIKVTGLRPGEKLYEELLITDNILKTTHPLIMSANEKYLVWEELEKIISELRLNCQSNNLSALRDLLIASPLDFTPKDEICDFLK
ncbi:polysaccharide biosynthesis protein [Providencia alcalifaciens]|uniref:nucleoside-diphosphate sugar epimerase/dehydratase n=1 Tax=Providencia alcalifaciens TaxID=126385 RepID=UPI001CE218D7|nr:nucleoside-diphosphate sugar epimerase/dehydratase [Providencia alcalifaciens]UBX50302.1 polysaccharide biosynthesis protein [Providencia alcalifaciens]